MPCQPRWRFRYSYYVLFYRRALVQVRSILNPFKHLAFAYSQSLACGSSAAPHTPILMFIISGILQTSLPIGVHQLLSFTVDAITESLSHKVIDSLNFTVNGEFLSVPSSPQPWAPLQPCSTTIFLPSSCISLKKSTALHNSFMFTNLF